MVYTRERLELADGDFLDLDWAKARHRRVAIISHGLEGSSTQNDVKTLAAALNAAGWDALAWNFRGCSGEENRLLQFYHSGETLDLSIVVGHAAAEYPEIAVVGFSLGGNMILKLGIRQPTPADLFPKPLLILFSTCSQPVLNAHFSGFAKRLPIHSAATQPAKFEPDVLRCVRCRREFDDGNWCPAQR